MPTERGIAQYRVIQTPEFALEFLARMSGPGTFETSADVRCSAAFEGKPDISQRLLNNRDS
jgi:hypothetical protein